MNKLISLLKEIGIERLAQKFSAAVVYAVFSSFALNFFYQPGHIYSSGATGFSQVISEIVVRVFGHDYLPISVTLVLVNVPLIILAWQKLGKQFTVYTVLTIAMSSIFIHFVPVTPLTHDPVTNAVFGGAIMGFGVGNAMKSGISSGGTDVVSLYIRKKTGRTVGRLAFIVNGCIVFVAGLLFGWEYMLYSLVGIFVSSRVQDAVFTRQKRLQVMIVTKNPDLVTEKLLEHGRHGITVLNNVEGAYSHEPQTVLLTVITMYEYQDFKELMEKYDPTAFVSISENVRVLGKFAEVTD
ncbi:YitT family protein [Lactococcus termiticola]|uniref:YitT family membrane protein n=1 Tax=Lactococcus termiticola TaxID=2169526 RepID=A0A2R5HGI8_9LACT|nr:YitT family protein [Lactococcus termiticola]GBG96455.1 YitT family membrane protein [Lactococcus termiticola]